MKKYIFAAAWILALFWGFGAFAQGKAGKRKSPSKASGTDINQWWVGIRGGMNFSAASSQKTYSVFSYLEESTPGDNEKRYNNFTHSGLQFGFSLGYEFLRGMSVNLLPSYASYRFSYENTFHWQDSENADKRVSMNYNYETRLQYIDLPLTIKYGLLSGKFKPYVQAGGYYSFLTDAIKKVQTTGEDQASGSEAEINITELSVGIDDRTKKNNYGIIGGVGFTYNLGNARVGLEANYMYGLQNLDNGGMKFMDNQLISGTYDVPDDYNLNNLSISMQVIIPLKFITSKDYVPL